MTNNLDGGPPRTGEFQEPDDRTIARLLTADPYGAYSLLANSSNGVHWHEPTRSWYVTAPKDVREMLVDRRFVARGASPLEPGAEGLPGTEFIVELERFLGLWPVFSDAPAQRSASLALRRYFSPARAEEMRPKLAALFAGIAQHADTRALVKTFAQPVSQAMLSVLLGLPDAEVDQIRSMTAPTMTYLSNDGQDADLAYAALKQIGALEDWLEAKGSQGDDWVLAELRSAGVELSARELAAVYMQIVTGALDPTSNALAGSLRVIANSTFAQDLIASGDYSRLVDHCLSRDTGFHFAPRRTKCPMSFKGRDIAAGDRVVGVLAWAASAEAQDAGRAEVQKSVRSGVSMAFGHGRHFCLGANIAYVTLEEALRSLLTAHDLAELDVASVEKVPALGASVYRDAEGGSIR